MEDIYNIIYVEGDIVQTCVRLFIFALSLVFCLGVFNIIKGAVKSCN